MSAIPHAAASIAPVSPLKRFTTVLQNQKEMMIAAIAVIGIVAALLLRFAAGRPGLADQCLIAVLFLGGIPLVGGLLMKLVRGQFGSDLLAGMSIVTSIFLGEYLAGAFVVLMLSGGETLEHFAVNRASSVLRALAKRMPSIAHRKDGAKLADVTLEDVAIGDTLVVFPHDICPVDGVVTEGHGVMDEAYLTGEPYRITKTPGATVLSGAINGENALTIRATQRAVDSRYAKIMEVMKASEQDRPNLRRLGDKLGALYTPLAVALAIAAWAISGEATRFLAVLVVATPCPLLIAIPVAIIGSISLAARRGIIIKRPVVLEQVSTCRTIMFDKTGTLTYGQPKLSELTTADGQDRDTVLRLTAGLEQYSKHPLANAVRDAAAAAKLAVPFASEISERPGEGLRGTVDGHAVQITSRTKLAARGIAIPAPGAAGGLECIVLIDDQYAGTLRFRDMPRDDGVAFIHHLGPKHQFTRMMLISGDRESEVRYLAEQVGITEIHAGQSPEQKLAIVKAETAKARTLYIGDGINDAPSLLAANVGIAMGQNSDVTAEAAGVVILDSSLAKVDEFFHISARMRRIALQSAIGGMVLSAAGMVLATLGLLSPVAGAITQEFIDVLAIANALRAAIGPRALIDFPPPPRAT